MSKAQVKIYQASGFLNQLARAKNGRPEFGERLKREEWRREKLENGDKPKRGENVDLPLAFGHFGMLIIRRACQCRCW